MTAWKLKKTDLIISSSPSPLFLGDPGGDAPLHLPGHAPDVTTPITLGVMPCWNKCPRCPCWQNAFLGTASIKDHTHQGYQITWLFVTPPFWSDHVNQSEWNSIRLIDIRHVTTCDWLVHNHRFPPFEAKMIFCFKPSIPHKCYGTYEAPNLLNN